MIKLKDLTVIDDKDTFGVTYHLNLEVVNNLQDFIDVFVTQTVKEIVTDRLNKLLTDEELIKITNKSITETYFKDRLAEMILNQLKEKENK